MESELSLKTPGVCVTSCEQSGAFVKQTHGLSGEKRNNQYFYCFLKSVIAVEMVLSVTSSEQECLIPSSEVVPCSWLEVQSWE